MDKGWIVQLHESAILIATMLVGLIIYVYTLLHRRTWKKQNSAFLLLVSFVMFNSLTETIRIFLLPDFRDSVVARWLVHCMQFLYFATHSFLSSLFLYYVLLASGVTERNNRKVNRRKGQIYMIPVMICFLLVLVNPFIGLVYRLNEGGAIIRRAGELAIYAIGAFYFIVAAATLFRNWHSIETRKKWSMLLYFVFSLGGVLLQFYDVRIRSELFGEMLALLGIMLLVENEDERFEAKTGVYNRAALLADLNTSLKILDSFHAICVRITNADMLQRLLGTGDTDELIGIAAERLKKEHPRQFIYRTSPDSFILICTDSEAQAADLANRIYESFRSTFDYRDAKLTLKAVVMRTTIPEVFERREDVMLLSDGPLPLRETEHVLEGRELDYLVRRAEVESALHRGLEEQHFEVYYQPVYRTKGMSIYSAEALLRLKDSKIGNIMPDEFIPIAEQSGMIHRLGDYVLEEVCLFLSSGIPTEMGLDCIEINLSVLQCLQPGFVERVCEIVRKYDVEPCYINFEVTESAAAGDYAALDTVLKDLKGHGFLLSLDDYGIGYSNVRSVFSMDFEMVKIDKAILWEVQKDGNGRGGVILENSVNMIRQMNFKILVEGVETHEQLELLEELDVDYLQGYYFSRPVSKNELLGILRVTELARMEEQRARAASDAKSNFLANMSHEIRTPINAILGMNEMILRESKNSRILEYAQNIEGAGRTLVSLINDILDFSKIESGSMEIMESEYDLSSVVNDVVNMIQVKAREKNLDFIIHVDPDLPDALYGDGMRLRQIMVNILNNAVKYTQKGSVTLEVNGELCGRDQLKLVVAVADTGIGIREEDIGKLFNKFQRFDEGMNRAIEGSGLGLAITWNLLQIMKGEISARSVYGKGSTFTVMLPQRIVRKDAIGDFRRKYLRNVKEREIYHESFRAPEACILVVDDTPVNHLVIRELLKKTKIQIDTAMSGRECLEMVRRRGYDLIFLDFRMPEMDGIETLHILRGMEEHPNSSTPVIALTANAVAGARERFLGEGFDEYMIKPVDGRKLEEMLLRFLPPVKIQHGGAEDEEAEENAEAEDWMKELSDIDYRTGLKNCGSADGYRSVLKIYYEGMHAKADEIERLYRSADWENYTIQVHALKSSSRVIGATELGEEAWTLEQAGNALDLDTIREKTEALLTHYRSYEKVLAGLFGEDSEDAAEEELPEISAAELKDAYETMKDFANLYDYDNMLFILDSLKGYRLPAEDREKLRNIRTWAENFQWEEIAGILG